MISVQENGKYMRVVQFEDPIFSAWTSPSSTRLWSTSLTDWDTVFQKFNSLSPNLTAKPYQFLSFLAQAFRAPSTDTYTVDLMIVHELTETNLIKIFLKQCSKSTEGVGTFRSLTVSLNISSNLTRFSSADKPLGACITMIHEGSF